MTPEITAWVEKVIGGKVSSSYRIFGGGSRETYVVDVASPGGRSLALILKQETGGGSHAGTDFSLGREYTVYRALESTGVPAPKVHGLMDDGNALLMERVDGDTNIASLPEGELRDLVAHFIGCLGALHSLDVDELDLPGFARPSAPRDHAMLELDRWEQLAAHRTGHDHPMTRYALAWLRHDVPEEPIRAALIQGDTGPGNFLARNGRVTGLVDWEFSHLGDPHDDIAWVRSRARGSAFGKIFDSKLPDYERLSGYRIDPARVAYYDVFVIVRLVVTTAMAVHKGGGAMGLAGYMMAHQSAMDRLGPAILEAMGAAAHESAQLPEPRQTPRTRYFDRVLNDLNRTIRTEVRDKEAKLQLNGVNLLVNWLRLHDQIGAVLEAADRSDQQITFGRVIPREELLTRADAGGRAADLRLLRYLSRSCERDSALWRFDPRAR